MSVNQWVSERLTEMQRIQNAVNIPVIFLFLSVFHGWRLHSWWLFPRPPLYLKINCYAYVNYIYVHKFNIYSIWAVVSLYNLTLKPDYSSLEWYFSRIKSYFNWYVIWKYVHITISPVCACTEIFLKKNIFHKISQRRGESEHKIVIYGQTDGRREVKGWF